MTCRGRSLKNWTKRDPDEPGISKSLRRNILYFSKMDQATPVWADEDKIKAIYKECKRRRDLGEDVVVDHKVPLNSKYVQGLHWEGNLEIISYRENEKKSNKYWPDMWEKQFDLFGRVETEQYRLSI